MNKLLSYFSVDFLISYSGKSFLVLIFLFCLILLFILNDDLIIKDNLGITSILIGIIFVCPIFHIIFNKFFDGNTYYRFLWLLPFSIVIAYVFTKISKGKIFIILPLVCLLAISGKYVYANEIFSKSENEYHLPQEMIEICDVITPKYFESLCCFPMEFIHQVRQYTTKIDLIYGREVLVSGWGGERELFEEVNGSFIDGEKVTQICLDKDVEYLILNKNKKFSSQLPQEEWVIYYETKNYYVYKEINVLSTWERTSSWLKTLSIEDRNKWLESTKLIIEEGDF